jgi:hypothetical protein
MTLRAASFFSEEPDSEDAGRLVARGMRDAFGGEQLQVAMVYATVNHDQAVLLEAVRRELGPGVPLLGCSVQGLACNEEVLEEGLVVGIMGFGGTDLRCATAAEHDIGTDARESGSKLVKQLKEKLGREPKLIVLMYDPLCGADIEALLGGMRRETACPVIGGAAGQPWGRGLGVRGWGLVIFHQPPIPNSELLTIPWPFASFLIGKIVLQNFAMIEGQRRRKIVFVKNAGFSSVISTIWYPSRCGNEHR